MLPGSGPGVFPPWVSAEEFPVHADAAVEHREGKTLEGPPPPYERGTALYVTLVITRQADGRSQWREVARSPVLPERDRAAPSRTGAEDPPLSRPIELVLPKGARPGSDSVLTFDSRHWPARPRLGEVARALHEAAGVDVIADSFARARVDPAWISGRNTVAAILDALARELDYNWAWEGGCT